MWGNIVKFIAGVLATMWAGIGGLFYCVMFLVFLDIVLGICASIKEGHSFESSILRKGLLEKFLLYTILFIVTYVGETIIHLSFPYIKFYLVGLYAALVGFYEMASIIEKLIIIYPKNKVLKRLAKWLNVWNKKLDSKAEGFIN